MTASWMVRCIFFVSFVFFVVERIMTSIKRLRFALIGTGNFGPHFAPYINEVADLVAICDPNPQSRARFAGQTELQLPIITLPLYPELENDS